MTDRPEGISDRPTKLLAEIIAVGAELTSGAKLNTNSQWLSAELSDLGIDTGWHTTITDDLAINVEALRLAIDRADLVLMTGGLGPTLDDLTREALAEQMNVELVLDETSLHAITSYFQNRGRAMPERNQVQALFPRGSTPLPNPVGTAPGIWVEIPRRHRIPCCIGAMPGVPSEMYRMFREQLVPRLPNGGQMIVKSRINCFGCGESQAEELLGEITARGRDPEVGITAHEATITLRTIAHAVTRAECLSKIATTESLIRERLEGFVYGVEDEEIEDVAARELRIRGESLWTEEAGTCGVLAQRWMQTGSACYRGGLVSPDLPDRLPELMVRAETQRASHETAYVLLVSRFPPPPTELGGIPVKAHVVLASAHSPPVHAEVILSGNPAIHLSRTAKIASKLLLDRLTEKS
ncbi:MAG: damage-inducible protein CinA [Planctomycetota bacterium]|nr:MAG: damage-inducible protein CinA [Planctomycetota bacterium]